MTVRPGRYGQLDSFVLEGRSLQIEVVPALGARAVSLLDRRTHREWLVTGEPPTRREAARWSAPDALFGGREAFGWDECLPTVAPCPDPTDRTAPPLRDHGDCWGRTALVTPTGDCLVAEWSGLRWPYRLRRTLRLAGSFVVIDYELDNRGDRMLPFLWSMHPLLALPAGSRIVLPESVTEVGVGWTTDQSLGTSGGTLAWPGPLALDTVGGRGAGRAAKLYARAASAAGAAVTGADGSRLALDWSAGAAPYVGLWLDDGGWPVPDGRTQHGLEPTTAPVDDLGDAIQRGAAVELAPGQRRQWRVTMRIG